MPRGKVTGNRMAGKIEWRADIGNLADDAIVGSHTKPELQRRIDGALVALVHDRAGAVEDADEIRILASGDVGIGKACTDWGRDDSESSENAQKAYPAPCVHFHFRIPPVMSRP